MVQGRHVGDGYFVPARASIGLLSTPKRLAGSGRRVYAASAIVSNRPATAPDANARGRESARLQAHLKFVPGPIAETQQPRLTEAPEMKPAVVKQLPQIGRAHV